MPSMDLGEPALVAYDFLPETSHLLQFERPRNAPSVRANFSTSTCSCSRRADRA